MDEEQVASIKVLEMITIPSHFPEITFPIGNAFSKERWVLGKKLFYDRRLSIDSTISCASCHKQNKGFADDVSLTPGVFGRAGVTNAPSLANIAYHPYYTREGGLPTLEMQVLVPISEHNEFGFNIVEIEQRLKADTAYQEMAMKAYGRSLDPFVITRSISTYERSIISGNSKYDDYTHGKAILSKEEMLGKVLFFSVKTNCSQCHSGFNFTNYEFKNNGLYEIYSHPGRFRLTQKESDVAMFKTPSLRNVGFTSPYMHDGSITTLENVVDHYNNGGKTHTHKSELIKPLGLTSIEKKALVAFLHTLDDNELLTNPFLSE
ncbi:MAG: cytochrome-c peroxidase [Saprospiraceae bacterium]|nr:cytochrome-c peroxidase [Saprospiraceae bacterium]